jgi:hypothetical protein
MSTSRTWSFSVCRAIVRSDSSSGLTCTRVDNCRVKTVSWRPLSFLRPKIWRDSKGGADSPLALSILTTNSPRALSFSRASSTLPARSDPRRSRPARSSTR